MIPFVDSERVVACTRRWVDQVVVGLDLCPFAESSIARGGLRIEVCKAQEPEALALGLIEELRFLQSSEGEPYESSLLVHPLVLGDFDAFNAFLEVCDRALADLGLVGVFQIASFHPDYCFEDAPAGDPAHFSNRSPYPMLHLLREEAVARAVLSHPDPQGIPQRNVKRLREVGEAQLEALLADCRALDSD